MFRFPTNKVLALIIGAIGLGGILVLRPRLPAAANSSEVYVGRSVRHEQISSEGWVTTYQGADVDVSAESGGTVSLVRVKEKDHVRKGEPLISLDDSEQQALLAEARARMVEASVDERFFAAEWFRTLRLLRTKAVSREVYERAVRDQGAADARLSLAVASIRRMESTISKLSLTAPIDGVVATRRVDAGETVTAGALLLRIVDLSRRRIEVEIDDFDSGRLVVGAKAAVTAEGFAGERWSARVTEIPEFFERRRARPEDPARATDTRVLLVKLDLLEDSPLRIGQRVAVEIESREVAATVRAPK